MLGSSIIVNLTRVILVMVLTRYYSKAEFGVWATITSTAAVLATGDFGITNALRNKVSIILADHSDGVKEASRYFYAMLIFLTLVFATIILFLFIFRSQIPFGLFFKTSDSILKSQASDIFFWIQIMYLVNIPLGIGIPLFFSFHESGKAAIFPILQSCLSFLVTVVLAIFNANIVAISLSYFGVNVIISGIGTFYLIRSKKWYTIDLSVPRFFSIIKEIVPQGVKFMLLQVGSSILQNAGTICLGAAVSVSAAAEFNVVQKLYTFFVGIYQSILNPLWGELATDFAKKRAKKCKDILIKSSVVLLVGFLTFMFILCFGGNFFIRIFAGIEYETTPLMFISVGLISLFYLLYANISTLQNATNNITLITIINVVGALLIYPLTKLAPSLGVINTALSLAFFWALFGLIVSIQSFAIIKNIAYENN